MLCLVENFGLVIHSIVSSNSFILSIIKFSENLNAVAQLKKFCLFQINQHATSEMYIRGLTDRLLATTVQLNFDTGLHMRA